VGLFSLVFILFSALFEAVEQQDLDLVKTLLEGDGLHINR
jgi:hypothetical protein